MARSVNGIVAKRLRSSASLNQGSGKRKRGRPAANTYSNALVEEKVEEPVPRSPSSYARITQDSGKRKRGRPSAKTSTNAVVQEKVEEPVPNSPSPSSRITQESGKRKRGRPAASSRMNEESGKRKRGRPAANTSSTAVVQEKVGGPVPKSPSSSARITQESVKRKRGRPAVKTSSNAVVQEKVEEPAVKRQTSSLRLNNESPTSVSIPSGSRAVEDAYIKLEIEDEELVHKGFTLASLLDEANSEGEEGFPSTSKISSTIPIDEDVFRKFKDLDRLLEHVAAEFEKLASSDVETRSDAWERIFAKGRTECLDWSEQPYENIEDMWNVIVDQTKKLQLDAFSVPSKGLRCGMKRQMYDDVYRFIQTGEYPPKMDRDSITGKAFKVKCKTYSINSSDQLVHHSNHTTKVVLLEGEVDTIIRLVHSALGHLHYQATAHIISAEFRTSCVLGEVAKAVVGECKTNCKRLVSADKGKSVRICFERTPYLNIKVVLYDQILPPSELPCDTEHTSNVARLGMSSNFYQHICTVLNDRKNSEYRRYSKLYKLDRRLGLTTIEGKIVLDDAIGADVIFQIHNAYGHITSHNLKNLVLHRFECSALNRFCRAIRSFCPFCDLKAQGRIYATPSRVYENAKYNVHVALEDGERKITITPIALNQKMVDDYILKVLDRNGGNMDDVMANESSLVWGNCQLLPIHHTVLRLAAKLDSVQTRSERHLIKQEEVRFTKQISEFHESTEELDLDYVDCNLVFPSEIPLNEPIEEEHLDASNIEKQDATKCFRPDEVNVASCCSSNFKSVNQSESEVALRNISQGHEMNPSSSATPLDDDDENFSEPVPSLGRVLRDAVRMIIYEDRL